MLQKIKKIDGAIVVVLLLLMVISIFSIYSVTHGREDLNGMHIKMIKFYILGLVAFLGLTFIDYRLIVKYALYIYITGIGILVLVSFIGKTQNGAQGWLKFGGFSLQPAELFKLILILFLAAVLVRKNKNRLLFWKDVVPLGLLTMLPFLLIGLLIIASTAAAGIMSYIHYHDQIKTFLTDIGRSHWVERFDPWLVPEKATAKASYHTKNAKLAIASGGMSGEGYTQGSSVQTDRVPYTYSDSIFVQIAEEFGFVGSALLLLLYFILIHRMILIALECKDRGGPFLIVGIVAMILYQIFENIGAFIGLMPLTGITLPFVSFGGTSLLINMASIGLVMSVRLHGREVEENLPTPAAYPAAAKQG